MLLPLAPLGVKPLLPSMDVFLIVTSPLSGHNALLTGVSLNS